MIIRYLLLSVKHLFVPLYFVTTVHFYVSTYKQVIKTQFEATQPLRYYISSNHLIEFIKLIPHLIKTPFETTQPLRY